MKHILIFLTYLAFSAALAQGTTKKEVYCDKTETIISTLKSNDYKEEPVWLGKSEESLSNFTLFVNNENKSWTIIQFNKDAACVLGSGTNAVFVSKKSFI